MESKSVNESVAMRKRKKIRKIIELSKNRAEGTVYMHNYRDAGFYLYYLKKLFIYIFCFYKYIYLFLVLLLLLFCYYCIANNK